MCIYVWTPQNNLSILEALGSPDMCMYLNLTFLDSE
jgi:hypothetical protein